MASLFSTLRAFPGPATAPGALKLVRGSSLEPEVSSEQGPSDAPMLFDHGPAATLRPGGAAAGRAETDAEFLERATKRLKAARSELDLGPLEAAERGAVEALIARVRKHKAQLGGEIADHKAKYVAEGVAEKLHKIDAGTFEFQLDNVVLATSVETKHAPKVDRSTLLASVKAWALGLEAGAQQANQVAPLVELLQASGWGRKEAARAIGDGLSRWTTAGDISCGGWVEWAVIHAVYDLLGLPQSGTSVDTKPPPFSALPESKTCRSHLSPKLSGLLDALDESAAVRGAVDTPRLERLAEKAGMSPVELDPIRDLFRRAPVHVRFTLSAGLLDGLEAAPSWKTLHETGTSQGNVDVGDRDAAERHHFRFDDSSTVSDRPHYGCLNLTNSVDGQASHYGDCALVLKHAVKERASVSFGDSFGGGAFRPRPELGTFRHFDGVLEGLVHGMDFDRLKSIASGEQKRAPYYHPPSSDLYLEVQIFGALDLKRDVEAIIIGPGSAGSPEAKRLVALAKKLGVPVLINPPSGYADVGFIE